MRPLSGREPSRRRRFIGDFYVLIIDRLIERGGGRPLRRNSDVYTGVEALTRPPLTGNATSTRRQRARASTVEAIRGPVQDLLVCRNYKHAIAEIGNVAREIRGSATLGNNLSE